MEHSSASEANCTTTQYVQYTSGSTCTKEHSTCLSFAGSSVNRRFQLHEMRAKEQVFKLSSSSFFVGKEKSENPFRA